MIAIKPSRTYMRNMGLDDGNGITELAWTESAPFVVNPRGVLTHRVRCITTYFWEKKIHHFNVGFLCGNCCNVAYGKIMDVTVSDPPEDRLLCERCEWMAIREDLPSGDTLAGRHVHRGILVPQQTCCKDH